MKHPVRHAFLAAFFLLLSLSLVSNNAFAQTPDSLRQKDSVNSELLNSYSTKLKEIERQQTADSLKKASLEKELEGLKTTDNLKKEDLQKQLQELSNGENRRLADKKARIDALRANAKPYPVLGFFNDTLFVIYSKLGSFSASDRAKVITERVGKLSSDITFSDKTLQVAEAETTLDILNGNAIIMSVSETDALWNNTTKETLAQTYRDAITGAVLKYKKETGFMTLAKEVALALLVLGILAALLFYVGRFFSWTARKIAENEGERLKGVNIKDYTLFDAQRMAAVLLLFNKLLKWLVYFTLIYISLPIIFGFFPWTQNFAQTLFGYVFNPLRKIAAAIWNYLPNLFTILVIFYVFRYTIKGIHFLKTEVENGKLQLTGFYPDWANPTFQILRVILYAFMFVLIFPYLPGSNSPVFQGVSVFLGFLFTFGSAGSLSNVIAGIVLTYMRLFKIGDRVKIGEVSGDVIEKSMLVTRVRTPHNEIISIPNSTVMSSHTINYSNEAETGQGLIIHTTITIGYDVPWTKVYKAALEAASRTSTLLKDPPPFVLQTSLEDFYVAYEINGYTRRSNSQASVYSELHAHLQDCCNEAGIEIMSPHYRAARDGNTTTIPENYLDKDYKAPGFNLNIQKEE